MFIFLNILLLLIFLLALLFFVILFAGLFFSKSCASPWVPLTKKYVERSLKIADLKPTDILYDLGSGDGRIVIAAAKKYKVQSRGIELVWPLCLISNLLIKLAGLGRLAKVKCGNIMKEDFSEATVIICYLMPNFLEALVPKFKKELKPGTKIISAAFKINGLTLLKIDRPTPNDKPIYLYQI